MRPWSIIWEFELPALLYEPHIAKMISIISFDNLPLKTRDVITMRKARIQNTTVNIWVSFESNITNDTIAVCLL